MISMELLFARVIYFAAQHKSIAAVSASLLLIACGAQHDQTPARASDSAEKLLRRAISGEPSTLDPHSADDTFSFPVVRDLYEGLTAENGDGKVTEGCAQSWNVDPSGTRYIFTLRPNAKWSNGEQVVASEFVAGLRRAVDPVTASGSAGMLLPIKNASSVISGRLPLTALAVESPDSATVVIDMENPAPYILQILSQPISAPLYLEGAHSGKVSDASITNGAYRIVKRIPGAFIELVRNENYWNSERVQVKRVRYMIEDSESSEFRQFESGQLEMTATVPLNELQRAKVTFSRELQISPILGVLFIALNLSNEPFKSNKQLRQALSMAIDRESIAETVALYTTPAFGFVADGIRGYSPQRYSWSSLKKEQRLDIARRLYEKAGFGSARPLRLRLFFNANEGIRRLMIAIAGNWKENLGVITDFESSEFKVFLAERKDRKRWDAIRLGWFADFEDATSFLNIFESDNAQNDAAYSNHGFDNLMKLARGSANNGVRRQLLEEAERTVLEDYPVIPVYFYNSRRLVSASVSGATITPLNRTYSKNLYWNSAKARAQ